MTTKTVLGYTFRPLTKQESYGLAGCQDNDLIAYAGDLTLILTAEGSIIEIDENGAEHEWIKTS